LPRKCINDFSDIILNGSSRLWIYMMSLSIYILTLFVASCFSCNLLIFCQEKEMHTIPFYPYTQISCLIRKWCLIIHICASRLPWLIWVYL
jgi:hypothetical protein